MTERVLTPEEATKLIATCDARTPIDLRDRAMIVVGLETGMRSMALAGMNLEAIRNSKHGYPVVPVPIRGAHELYPVPLSDAAIAALEPWRAWLRSCGLTRGAVLRPLTRRVARGGKLVYEPDESGDPLSRMALYKIVSRRAESVGLAGIHPNIFRGTFVAWRMRAGLPPHKIAAITGLPTPLMRSLNKFVDVTTLGVEARRATPAWLAKLVRRG